MKPRSMIPALVITLLALSGVMCTLTNPGASLPTPDPTQKQATLAVMQSTVNAAAQVARLTAEAWMTESSPATIEPGEQTPPTVLPTGTIKGALSYPGEQIPPLRVVAFNIDTGEYASVEVQGSDHYTLAQVPVGEYYVVAYPMEGDVSVAGGYSAVVTCGLQEGCTDHTLIIVKVNAGEVTNEVNPADWYAPPGTYPPQP